MVFLLFKYVIYNFVCVYKSVKVMCWLKLVELEGNINYFCSDITFLIITKCNSLILLKFKNAIISKTLKSNIKHLSFVQLNFQLSREIFTQLQYACRIGQKVYDFVVI